MTGRANYGLDAPIIVRNNTILGVAAILGGAASFFVLRHDHPDLAQSLLVNGAFAAAILLGIAAFMCWSQPGRQIRRPRQSIGHHRLAGR